EPVRRLFYSCGASIRLRKIQCQYQIQCQTKFQWIRSAIKLHGSIKLVKDATPLGSGNFVKTQPPSRHGWWYHVPILHAQQFFAGSCFPSTEVLGY
ncbi:MAG: hypothetical protein ACI83I_002866, partial [Bacteroidia bacterium]